MHIENLSVEDLQRGYTCSSSPQTFQCLLCPACFVEGEIFPVNGRYFDSARAVELHMQEAHPDYLHQLIGSDSKYNSLTQNQQQLLELFATGTPDKEIAKATGVSLSTVRHQRFVFREKAKQAKLYLAVYERVFSGKQQEHIVPVHQHATMVDQRYVVTEEEREHILQTAFSSLEPLRLKSFSPKEKKKVVILAKITQAFQPGTQYSEKEVNDILREIYGDYATLRRYLIEYGFMKRTKDGSSYWLT